jgi:hypothetical protein
MQNRKTFLSLAVLASAGLLAAAPAMAQDPAPPLTCSTGTGWSITTTGPVYGPCNGSTCTTITYNVSGSGTPDHVATFVRAEAGVLSTTPSASLTQTTPCGGDSVIGVAAGAVCHERIGRFNNQSTKANSFTLTVNGRRKPLATSVVVRKGNIQGACRIAGFGLLDTTGGDACVSSCGNFSPNQSVRKVETFKFKNCEVTFEFDLNTGQVLAFDAQPVATGTSCNKLEGSVSDLFVAGGIITGTDEEVTFGDGWINSGQNSCTTRLVGGRYYTVCQ